MNITNVLIFLLTMVLTVGGMVLMGYAFATPGFETLMFSAGALAMFVGFAVPAIMWRLDQRAPQQ